MLIGGGPSYFYFLFFGISGKSSFSFPQINNNFAFLPSFIHNYFQPVFHNLSTTQELCQVRSAWWSVICGGKIYGP